jgi:hypothetical protein
VSNTVTEIVRASELQAKVIDRIFELRNPSAIPEHKKALAGYTRRRGKRKEVEGNVPGQFFARKGFFVLDDGQPVLVERPELKCPPAYGYTGYDRFLGHTTHARVNGLLASPQLNRDIRPQRVDEYTAEMRAGRWRDLLSDPIAITKDGHVVNGQHRLAAASRLDWSKIENDPAFLVIWDVSPLEATLADGSRRTQRDERTIAARVANVTLHWLKREQARGTEAA